MTATSEADRDRARFRAILAEVDRLRAMRERSEPQLDAFVRIYFLEQFGDPQSNPRRWPSLALGALGENQNALRSAGGRAASPAGQGFPRYGARAIVDWTVDAAFQGERLLVAADGINLVTRLRPVTRVVNGRFDVNVHAHVIAGNGLADLHYLRFALELTELKAYLASVAAPKLKRADMERIPIPVPPLTLQYAFRVLVEKAERIKALQRASSLKLAELGAALRHHGLRGSLIADR